MARSPNQDANLLKGKATQFNGETAAIAGRKGGAAGKGRGGFNHVVKEALKKPMRSGEISSIEELESLADASGRNFTAEEIIGLQLVQKAMKGDKNAIELLMDRFLSTEESPDGVTKAALGEAVTHVIENIATMYAPMYGDILKHGHTHYDLRGGRGSWKSSFVSLVVPELIMRNPDTHALVLRKVSNTLRDSVFAQYQWAIAQMGVADLWEAKKTPMELIYKPTGQRIMFRGVDDPMKIKSIKVAFGYIAITHFEEKDQFAGREEIRNILQSTQRSKGLFWNFESYNPPRSRDNWANKDSLEERPDRMTMHSTYLMLTAAERELLGEQFTTEAEHLRAVDEDSYRHEYLGEPVGNGGNVFEKIEIREITDEEIAAFDRIYQGVDYGWYPDKYAFLRTYYNANREEIYLIDEHYVNKESNQTTAQWIIDKGYNDYLITCDSAEPKSVNDYRDMGLQARGAKKGPGSIDYGFKWLQSRRIIIDPARTPYACQEIVNYEYERDKDGNVISGYPGENDHAIAALRYAYESLFNKRGNSA